MVAAELESVNSNSRVKIGNRAAAQYYQIDSRCRRQLGEVLFRRGGENRLIGVLRDRSQRTVKVEHDEPVSRRFQRHANLGPFIEEMLHAEEVAPT